jgi:hypothetical protein
MTGRAATSITVVHGTLGLLVTTPKVRNCALRRSVSSFRFSFLVQPHFNCPSCASPSPSPSPSWPIPSFCDNQRALHSHDITTVTPSQPSNTLRLSPISRCGPQSTSPGFSSVTLVLPGRYALDVTLVTRQLYHSTPQTPKRWLEDPQPQGARSLLPFPTMDSVRDRSRASIHCLPCPTLLLHNMATLI